ncbi:MAG: alpha/beta fold hydrolase [Leptolyngbyaceae cyanobacterium]
MALPLRNGRIRLSQGSLFWREVGSGPTIVFLHGNWADGSQWIPLMAQLGDHFHCLAPDLLGFGESSRLRPTDYSIALQAQSLAEYLERICSRSIILVAEGVGAWTATRYAQSHPEQVRGLVVIAPEGVSAPALKQRWRRTRWLAGRWSLGAMGLMLFGPLGAMLGQQRWLRRTWQRRRQLRDYEATCRLLFLRRRQDLKAERLERQLPELLVPVKVLQPQRVSPTTHALNQAYSNCFQRQVLQPVPVSEAELWNAPEVVAEILQDLGVNVIAPGQS